MSLIATEDDLRRLCIKHRTNDMHVARACEDTGKLKEQITPEDRDRAKSMNFLILYSSKKKISGL